jgi:DNA-binding beta-propeller fold protein YncE
MRRLLPLLALAALAAGCSSRERLNPLDPANRATGGAPQGFAALAGDRSAVLQWTLSTTGLTLGVRLFRATGAAAPESLADLPPGVTEFFDTGLANGVDYTYRLSYVLQNGALSGAATDVATPGTARPWVADYSAHTVSRITPDGRHIAESISQSFKGPSALDVNSDGRVWVCDPLGGRLWRVTPGLFEEEVGSLQQPVAVTIDRRRARVWVCDQGLGALQGLDPVNAVAPYVDVRGLARPLDVGVDPIDGSVWVCERTGDRVRHISFAGDALGSAIATAPSRVAVDSVTHRVWVSSVVARRVTVFGPTGTALDSLTNLAGPVGIAIDPIAGSIWVADTDGDRVIVFDRAGGEKFRVTNVYQPLEIAIDRATGEAWVAQASIGQVTRISADGHVLRRTGGFSQPYDIALAP